VSDDAANRGAIVITGASTGIGAGAAERMARDGFIVFAGVRNAADGERLAAAHPNIRSLMLEVTDPASSAAAAATVRASGLPLRGLVNNAGIAVAGPLEFLPIDQIRRVFEVNFFGALAVTQAFLPLLRPPKGRIVFIGSIAGRLPIPFVAPYSTSKFALRAASDALRIELRPSGVRVALLEPSSVKTPIWKKGRDSRARLLASMPPEALERYGPQIAGVLDSTEGEERSGMPVERISDAIAHALTDPKPRARYLLGAGAKAGGVIALLPPLLRAAAMRRSLKLP
jgi:NAD(P)-dependent dehydrogenase (short-subunit alcohol dehydrogenase family)